jgi:GTP-binding protein HflX
MRHSHLKASLNSEIEERALLVQCVLQNQDKAEWDESLKELERLAYTAGAVVVGAMTQRRQRPDAGFFIGHGKLAEIQLACRAAGANLVIFDNELSPIQVNNLDLALGIKVIDRTELILQIFARRARSAESQIQVELAQLQYLASRIPVSAKQHRFRGGIGMKGPGESPFQLRRAPIMARITALKKKLAIIQKQRERRRITRNFPIISLVGYTNVGKSTILKALTAADVYIDDRLFATLDTRTRLVYLGENRKALVTDTVGFIRNLPHSLVASFHSTLEEISDSDLLLIVGDASHPRCEEQIAIVKETLKEISADGVPHIFVFNKIDKAVPDALASLQGIYPDSVYVSALKKDGLSLLKGKIANMLFEEKLL